MSKKRDMTLQNVFWYMQGDPNNGGYAAVVVSDDGAQGLKLDVLRGSRIERMSGVRNLDDPLLQERPAIKRNNGAWESLEQYQERKAFKELQAEESRKAAQREREEEFKARGELAKKLAENKKPEPVSV
jgi:hypothetical protein